MSSESGPGQELRQVLASIDPLQVRMARDLLAEGGIESFVFDVEASRMLGSAAAVPARLMVRNEDFDDALARLKELGFED